jgi:hypothetical protein
MVHRLTITTLLLIAVPAIVWGAEVVPDEPGVIRIPVAPAPMPPQRVVIRNGQVVLIPNDAQAAELDIAPRDRNFASDSHHKGPLDEFVAALRSPSFEARDEATTALLRLSPDRLGEIQSLLARESDAEAAARLTQVAIHLFLKARTPLEGQASLLGIKFNDELVRTNTKDGDLSMSIAVMELQPGYPAAQELRVGDRLLGIDGKRFPVDMPRETFPSLVRAHYPGEVVTFTILRQGKEMDVKVQLAGLPVAGVLNLEQAIEQRNAAANAFVTGLKTGRKDTPLVIEDKTVPVAQPIELQLQN